MVGRNMLSALTASCSAKATLVRALFHSCGVNRPTEDCCRRHLALSPDLLQTRSSLRPACGPKARITKVYVGTAREISHGSPPRPPNQFSCRSSRIIDYTPLPASFSNGGYLTRLDTSRSCAPRRSHPSLHLVCFQPHPDSWTQSRAWRLVLVFSWSIPASFDLVRPQLPAKSLVPCDFPQQTKITPSLKSA